MGGGEERTLMVPYFQISGLRSPPYLPTPLTKTNNERQIIERHFWTHSDVKCTYTLLQYNTNIYLMTL